MIHRAMRAVLFCRKPCEFLAHRNLCRLNGDKAAFGLLSDSITRSEPQADWSGEKSKQMSTPYPIVLVVDDETQIRRFLRTGLELNQFVVHEAGTGADAIRAATMGPIDVIIVDLGLPDMDGSQVVERIRAWSNVPIIALSVRSAEAEKVRLLELGVDDYVVKPFGMAELLARVRVGLRRQRRTESGESKVTAGPLTIDLATRTIFLNKARLVLTRKEYMLLQVLAQHAGNVVTHQQLLKEVWGSVHLDDTHYLRIFVRKLRKKIEAKPDRPQILVTELGIGYRLAQPENGGAKFDLPVDADVAIHA
jgi:two-component system KDP operon response regulator KdpE